MSSVESYESCDEVDGAEECAFELVIARRDGSELFEIVEETLDQIAFAVQHEIGLAWCASICLGRNDRRNLTRFEPVDEGIGIIGFVGQEGSGVDLFKERFGLPEIGGLARRERNRDRVAEGVSDHMDLCCQSTSGSANGLVPPFCAPALC